MLGGGTVPAADANGSGYPGSVITIFVSPPGCECSTSAITTGPLRSLKTPTPARRTFALPLPGA